jgi:hypothetical protein
MHRLPKLHTLSVCGCLLGASDTLLSSLDQLTRLTDVDLSDCPRITRNATKQLLRSHSNRANLQVKVSACRFSHEAECVCMSLRCFLSLVHFDNGLKRWPAGSDERTIHRRSSAARFSVVFSVVAVVIS